MSANRGGANWPAAVIIVAFFAFVVAMMWIDKAQ